MKKSLLVLILAVALVVPAFAAKGDMSVNAKVGLGVNSNVTISGIEGSSDVFDGFKVDMPFMLGAEFFYGMDDILSVGFGANYVFNTSAKVESQIKGGTTNIYVAVKPEFKVESDIFTSVYLIGQLGLSMGRCDVPESGFDIDSGIYLGAGFGATIKDAFLVELVFSSCNGTIKAGGQSMDIQYSITSLNIGYKFAL